MAFLGILEPRKQQKLGDRLLQSVGEMGPGIAQTLSDREAVRSEDDALKRLTGQDFSGLRPDLKKEFVKVFTGARSQKEQEKNKMLETGLGTIQDMRGLLEHAGGWTSNIMNKVAGMIPGSEAQQKRTQLAQLGTSLIPLASAGVSIRNQREFDQYKKIITDPDSSSAEFEGALDGLESIITRQMKNGDKEEESKYRPIFDISNPSHKKVRDALLKKYKNDRQKVSLELEKHYREE